MRHLRSLLLATALTVVLGAAAQAHPAEGHITDAEGDANLLNTQGFGPTIGSNPLDPGVGTGPASYAGADIRAVRFATSYTAISVGDDGIDYQPTGLRVTILTEVLPHSDGPTFAYRLNLDLGTCASTLSAFIRGASSLPNDPQHRALRWNKDSASCPGGVGQRYMAGPATIDTNINGLVLDFAYSGLSSDELSVMGEGVALKQAQAEVRTLFAAPPSGSGAIFPTIDETPVGADWMVGQDMPADVPCTLNCPVGLNGEAGA